MQMIIIPAILKILTLFEPYQFN
uniref:Uncharacterized protein n=1 Tax=Rhizophora mucronata TaxID=61149 RepID=A0A2P2PX51_RHIMU